MRDRVEHCWQSNVFPWATLGKIQPELSTTQPSTQVIVVIVYQPRVVACQCRLERPRPPSRQAMCSDTYNIIKQFTPIAPY